MRYMPRLKQNPNHFQIFHQKGAFSLPNCMHRSTQFFKCINHTHTHRDLLTELSTTVQERLAELESDLAAAKAEKAAVDLQLQQVRFFKRVNIYVCVCV